jgi:hypothetical protein
MTQGGGASPNSEAPRTVHSPSNPPEVTPGRAYVPVREVHAAARSTRGAGGGGRA